MRLFVGIEIELNDEIRKALNDTKKLGLRAVDERNLHINLKFLGEADEQRVEDIKGALDSALGFGGFEVELKDIGAFPNHDFIRVVWIGARSERLVALSSLIDEELARLGFNKEKSYTPHITLARVSRRTEGVRELLGEKDFGKQKVEEIHLIRSTLTPKGPVYEKIHSVKL